MSSSRLQINLCITGKWEREKHFMDECETKKREEIHPTLSVLLLPIKASATISKFKLAQYFWSFIISPSVYIQIYICWPIRNTETLNTGIEVKIKRSEMIVNEVHF